MKKIISIMLVAAALTSCGTQLVIPSDQPRKTTELFLDYSKYTYKGFLISPYPYTNEFEAIGEIMLVIDPAVTYKVERIPRTPYTGDTTTKAVITPTYEVIDTNELIDGFVDSAIERGADAAVNFKCNIRDGKYELSGYLIKRM